MDSIIDKTAIMNVIKQYTGVDDGDEARNKLLSRGLFSKAKKSAEETRGQVASAVSNTVEDALASVAGLTNLTISKRSVAEDEETPDLDYYDEQDIDTQEDTIQNIESRTLFGKSTADLYEARVEKPTDAKIISSSSDDDSAAEVQPTNGKDDEIVKFIQDLTMSESSGDSTADRTNKDGRRFAGLLQFGKDRLTDYKKATNTKFTQDQFVKDVSLQEKVALWHIKDIDKLIDKTKNKGKYTSRNGLRAVAHLGGRTGMIKFVKTQGSDNPADEEGTTLQDYYDKFKD